MPEFRRRYSPGGTFFFTLVTAARRPLLCRDDARDILRRAIEDCRSTRPFYIDAAVLLPDHLHMIWTLPQGDSDYSTRWACIKAAFSRNWLDAGGDEIGLTVQQKQQGRRGVWQPRFIEHTIRDEDDYIRHVEYIHYNPVKHGHVQCPRQWPHSSFHRFVAEGTYPMNWCCGSEPPRLLAATFLE